MRVITGEAKGRRLKTLSGEDVRPTAERVKEAIFSILQFDIEGRNMLDLFAGSGQMGIEALSRGARCCTFVDSSRLAASVIKENVLHCGFENRARIISGDSIGYISRSSELFDIAFVDPPYYSGLYAKALEPLAARMNTGGGIVCEAPNDVELPESAGDFTRRREYRYGRVIVAVYRHKSIED